MYIILQFFKIQFMLRDVDSSFKILKQKRSLLSIAMCVKKGFVTLDSTREMIFPQYILRGFPVKSHLSNMCKCYIKFLYAINCSTF